MAPSRNLLTSAAWPCARTCNIPGRKSLGHRSEAGGGRCPQATNTSFDSGSCATASGRCGAWRCAQARFCGLPLTKRIQRVSVNHDTWPAPAARSTPCVARSSSSDQAHERPGAAVHALQRGAGGAVPSSTRLRGHRRCNAPGAARTLRAAARSRRTRPHLKPARSAHRCAPLPPHQVSLEEVRARIHDFAAEREWQQFHTPRNLLLALVGEVRRITARGQLRSPAPVTNCAARPQRAFKVRSKASQKPHAPVPAQLLLPLVAIDRHTRRKPLLLTGSSDSTLQLASCC